MRNRLNSDKSHALQEVKRSVYEKDTLNKKQKAKFVDITELQKIWLHYSNSASESKSGDDLDLHDENDLQNFVRAIDVTEIYMEEL